MSFSKLSFIKLSFSKFSVSKLGGPLGNLGGEVPGEPGGATFWCLHINKKSKNPSLLLGASVREQNMQMQMILNKYKINTKWIHN